VWLGLDIQFLAKGYPLSVIQHFKLYEFSGLNLSVDDDTTKYCRKVSARRRRRQHGRRRR
jgi:hypothetical protein